jgi:phosphoribosylformylglycinamidine cyclo-ligase
LIGIPSSGLHSNGYSLARKVLLERGRLKLSHGEFLSWAESSAKSCSNRRASTPPSRADCLPTSTSKARRISPAEAITGNLPRVLPPGRRAVIERGSWPAPPVFALIKKIGAVEQGRDGLDVQ